MARPPVRLLALAICFVTSVFLLYLKMSSGARVAQLQSNPFPTSMDDLAYISPDMQQGGAIMGHLGNETAKAELGRAAWKLFHTTMARFPDTPSKEESAALKNYIYLFARLYPCGECATHFQKILKMFPPQTSSRSVAAAWGCHVHNQVNKSKGKPLFDCARIGDFYDCGCGDGQSDKASHPDGKGEMSEQAKTKLVQDGRDLNVEWLKPVQIATDGPTNGG